MTRLWTLLCLPLAACILTVDDDEDGPPAGAPYCGDALINQADEQCDDGNAIAGDGCTLCRRDSGDASYTASWTHRNIATNTTTGCPTGYDTAALYTQPTDAQGNPAGSVIVDLFDCAAGTGTVSNIVPGKYLVWLAITNATSTNTYAQTTSALLDLTITDQAVTFQVLNDGGYFQLRWNLVGATSDTSLTCAQAAAAGVDSTATDVSSPTNTVSDTFDCEDGYGITAGMRAATYTVSVSALNASDQAIGTAPELTSRTIGPRNAVTDLGTVTIPINGL